MSDEKKPAQTPAPGEGEWESMGEDCAKAYARELGGFPKGTTLASVNGHTRGWAEAIEKVARPLARELERLKHGPFPDVEALQNKNTSLKAEVVKAETAGLNEAARVEAKWTSELERAEAEVEEWKKGVQLREEDIVQREVGKRELLAEVERLRGALEKIASATLLVRARELADLAREALSPR